LKCHKCRKVRYEAVDYFTSTLVETVENKAIECVLDYEVVTMGGSVDKTSLRRCQGRGQETKQDKELRTVQCKDGLSTNRGNLIIESREIPFIKKI